MLGNFAVLYSFRCHWTRKKWTTDTMQEQLRYSNDRPFHIYLPPSTLCSHPSHQKRKQRHLCVCVCVCFGSVGSVRVWERERERDHRTSYLYLLRKMISSALCYYLLIWYGRVRSSVSCDYWWSKREIELCQRTPRHSLTYNTTGDLIWMGEFPAILLAPTFWNHCFVAELFWRQFKTSIICLY